MKRHHSLFILMIMLFLAGIFLMVFSGTTSLSTKQLWSIRFNQLQDAQLEPDRKINPILNIGTVIIPDYFELSATGYRYLGGLYDGVWEVGATYSVKDLSSVEFSDDQIHSFLTLPVGENGVYINIDRGDEGAVSNFLKVMDQHGQKEIDNLILDFRFLQSIDFGSLIRLFNQIAPQKQITLCTIINAYQEETIKSSGKPFFSVGRTFILVDSYMPLPLKKIIKTLSQESSYHLVGDIGTVPDTVCLQTKYEIGPETYRVCTEKLTGEGTGEQHLKSVTTIPDSAAMEWISEIDDIWYKDRDTTAMKIHLTRSLNFQLSE